jgi:hypothetical protein
MTVVEVIPMPHVHARYAGASICAIVFLISIAGCGDQRSILSPSDESLARGTSSSSRSVEVAPDARPAGNPGYTLWNSDFRYTNREGGYSLDPSTWVELDVAAGEPVTVNWVGRFRGGVHLRAYRWTLDIADISDETPRINEATDLSHWSAPSATSTSATVGPFATAEQHLFFVEITDTNGFRSLATVHMHVVGAAAEEARRR